MLEPICIFNPNDKSCFDGDRLQALLTEDVKDLKVVVLAIAGRFRQGKSFLLNIIIRYLRAGGKEYWLDEKTGLEGFDWRSSSKRVTLGVLIWPEVFKLKLPSGEDIAVVLIDSQGIYDTDTSIRECTAIFSLSVLLSSIEIFNLKQNIQGDDISNLEMFSEFGRLVSTKNATDAEKTASNMKPFQDLIFLVRDWSYPDDNPYGWEGGNELLSEVLEGSDAGSALEKSRQSIRNCFNSVRGYLMPHPGNVVDTAKNFSGKIHAMKVNFVHYLQAFVEDLLKSENLRPKIINGKEITLHDFCVFARVYSERLHDDELPTPQTLYDATVSATNTALVSRCLGLYQSRISQTITSSPQSAQAFEQLHEQAQSEARTCFDTSLKMGDETRIQNARTEMEAKMKELCDQLRIANSSSYQKKCAEEEVSRLQGNTTNLRVEMNSMGDAARELRRRLRQSEAELESLKAQNR